MKFILQMCLGIVNDIIIKFMVVSFASSDFWSYNDDYIWGQWPMLSTI